MKKNYSLNESQVDGFVGVVNSLIERFCEKYPDEYDFDTLSIGYTEEDGIISCNGDDLEDVLKWVNTEIIPDLCD